MKSTAKFTVSINVGYFDLVTTLRLLFQETLHKIEFGHVKGHQNKSSTPLSIWEDMNVVADAKVKVALWKIGSRVKITSYLHCTREDYSTSDYELQYL